MLSEQDQLLSADVSTSFNTILKQLLENFPQIRSVAYVIDWEQVVHNQSLPTGGCLDRISELRAEDVSSVLGLLAQLGKLQLHLLNLVQTQTMGMSLELTALDRQVELARKQLNVTRSTQREEQGAEEESQTEEADEFAPGEITRPGRPLSRSLLGRNSLRRPEATEEGPQREDCQEEAKEEAAT
jgi:hypothetical protein